MERPFRTFLICIGSFGLAGSFLMTWLAPKVIAWWFDPPAQMAFNCKDPIQWALSRYQSAQFFGLLGGAAAGLVLGILLMMRAKGRTEPGRPVVNRPL